jgi:hypothetical protein
VVHEETHGSAFIEVGACLLEQRVDGRLEIELLGREGGEAGRERRGLGRSLVIRAIGVSRAPSTLSQGDGPTNLAFLLPVPLAAFLSIILAILVLIAVVVSVPRSTGLSETAEEFARLGRDRVNSRGPDLDAAVKCT